MSEHVTTTSPTLVTYGEISFELDALPAKSLLAMVKRGVGHYLGNEQASKLTTWKEARETETGVPPTEEAIAQAKSGFQSDALAKLLAGEVGHSVRGPRGTAVDTVIRQIALERATKLLADAKLKMPVKDEVITTPAGATYTRAQLIQRQIDAEKGSKAVTVFGGKTVREAAEAKMRELDRAKAKSAETDLDELI